MASGGSDVVEDSVVLACQQSLERATERGAAYFGSAVLQAHADGVTGYQLQVAGHGGDATKKIVPGSAILKWKHYTLKPLQTKSRGVKEVAFYEALTSASDEDADVKIDLDVLSYLKQLTPSYHGVVQVMIEEAAQTFNYIVLEDITHGFSPACVMDIKIGRKMYEESAPEEKKQSEMRKFPQLMKIGFRYAGMILHNQAHNSSGNSNRDATSPQQQQITTRVDKQWGYQLKAEDASEGFVRFFYDEATKSLRHEPLQQLCTFADEMSSWFEKQSIMTCISSSLLIVYTPQDLAHPGVPLRPLQAKLIDFAHSNLQEGCSDASFSFGLQQMNKCLIELRELSTKLQEADSNTNEQSLEYLAAQLQHFKSANGTDDQSSTN